MIFWERTDFDFEKNFTVAFSFYVYIFCFFL